VIQRRALRAARALSAGTVISEEDLVALRPAPRDGVFPFEIGDVIGRKLARELPKGEHLTRAHLA
jgi:sialic acid synthase SpsE